MYAYVLIALKECDEKKVLEELRKLKNVKEAHILFGEWDIVAKIDCKTPEECGDFVMKHIRSIGQVKLSSTMIVAK